MEAKALNTRTEALRLASLGWHLCPMEAGSKNPGSILGKGWQTKCTNDEEVIATWPEDCNVGVLLGPTSGIIDLEFDSDQGEMLVNSWIEDCGGVVTPTYRSAKSTHRLFLWNDQYELEGAKFGLFGVEFRWGQDSAQSVLPPSLHESGVRYEWVDGLSPWDCGAVALPDLIYKQYLSMKGTAEKQQAKACSVPSKYVSGDTLLGKARKHVEETYRWESLLSGDGWKFCRNRGEAQDWWRPGKTRGSISGTVNFGGSRTLRVFTTSTGLEADSSYDKFAYLCVTKFNDDPVAAARGLTPPEILNKPREDVEKVNLSKILGEDLTPDFDHEEFCQSMVPAKGILRDAYNYYCETAHRKSHVMGLAVAVSLCETIFGRRVTSHTDLRTNDYNVIVAPTTSGKEACETALTKIFAAADINKIPLLPPDVQSGNGLLSAVDETPCGIWICDEFGKVLEAVLDAKGNGHVKQIGTHLLKLYGKASGFYGGAAHAAGKKHAINQPHLCLLGLTTGQVFTSIDSKQVQDGLIGRLAFWPVQNRPRRRTATAMDVPEGFAAEVRQWLHWEPCGLNPENPRPHTVRMTNEALERWESHADAIDAKMEHEFESRAAIWGRVAARAMKLALVHRCSRLGGDPASMDWVFVQCELQDIDWGIRIANWLGRISCNLIRENVNDVQAQKARKILLDAVTAKGQIDKRTLMREFTSVTGGEIAAAAENLKASGLIEIEEQPTGGRKKVVYRLIKVVA